MCEVRVFLTERGERRRKEGGRKVVREGDVYGRDKRDERRKKKRKKKKRKKKKKWKKWKKKKKKKRRRS